MEHKRRQMEAMKSTYQKSGATLLAGMVNQELLSTLLYEADVSLRRAGKVAARPSVIGNGQTLEVGIRVDSRLSFFHWGLTPYMEAIVERELLPTYAFFRCYQYGATCNVHSDRAACEHSASLTLAYSDEVPWALLVQEQPLSESDFFHHKSSPDFGGKKSIEFLPKPGDAIAYKGIAHRHGRPTANPNRWSAHLFLHWVDKNGLYANEIFNGQSVPTHSKSRIEDLIRNK